MPFVILDLLGTIFKLDNMVSAIQVVFGNEILELKDVRVCRRFFKYWYQGALYDYVACSQAGTYMGLRTILENTLSRALKTYFEDGYDDESIFSSQAQASMVMEAFDNLELNEKVLPAIEEILKQNDKWDIWILSIYGGHEETLQLIEKTALKEYISHFNIHCCDDYKLSTPHPKIYSELMRKAVHQTKRIENFYMIGSSASNLASAKNLSITTIFLDSNEKVFPQHIYQSGNPHLTAHDLVECVDRMFETERTRK